MSSCYYVAALCKDPERCDRCRRLTAIGQLVLCAIYMLSAQIAEGIERPIDIRENTAIDDAWETFRRNLEAVTELMIDRGRLVRAHRKELNEAHRDAQREARDAYAEGRQDASPRDGW